MHMDVFHHDAAHDSYLVDFLLPREGENGGHVGSVFGTALVLSLVFYTSCSHTPSGKADITG